MSDEQIETQINNAESLPKIDIEKLKLLHDVYAVTHQVLTQKCTFHHEEFEFMTTVVDFHKEQMLAIRKQLEEHEQKKVEDGSDKEQQ